jgi:hypothetical protein
LFTIGSNDAHFRIVDVFVDRIITFLGATAIIRIEVSDGICPPLSDKNSATIRAIT